jgi:outer membrane protein assembly factor BamB
MLRSIVRWASLAAGGLIVSVSAQEWPRFRGPNGGGLGVATNLPARWGDQDLHWKARLPGSGHSSPVLWGNRLFVTAADNGADRFSVVCLDADDGRPLWQRDLPAPHYALHRNNTFATSTPATDPERVYVPRVAGRNLLLTALSHEGESVWEFQAGTFSSEHGLGLSPVVHEGRLIFSKDHDEAGDIVALDPGTGRLLWKTRRSPGRVDYSAPFVFGGSHGEEWLIFNSQEDGICAVEPATGKVAWQSDRVLRMRSVSSPIAAAGLLFGSCGSGGGGNYLVALRPPARVGEKPALAYEVRRSAPYVPTPLALGPLLFLWSDAGVVTCVRAETGEAVWQERVGGNFFSSPVCADGKLINVSTTGEVVVLAAGDKYELLGRTPLGEMSHATPAIALGRLFIRTLQHVVCVKGGAGVEP